MRAPSWPNLTGLLALAAPRVRANFQAPERIKKKRASWANGLAAREPMPHNDSKDSRPRRLHLRSAFWAGAVSSRRSRGSWRRCQGQRKITTGDSRLSRRIIALHRAGSGPCVVWRIRCSCDYSARRRSSQLDCRRPASSLPGSDPIRGQIARRRRRRQSAADEDRTAILNSAMTLIQRAALQPGGEDFKLAVQQLNQYFDGTSPSEYQLESPAREYLKTQMPASVVEELADRNWIASRHAAHRRLHDVLPDRKPDRGQRGQSGSGSPGLRSGSSPQAQLVPPGTLGVRRLAPGVRPAVRRSASRHGDRGAGHLGRARLALHRALPPARDRRGADHLYAAAARSSPPSRDTA